MTVTSRVTAGSAQVDCSEWTSGIFGCMAVYELPLDTFDKSAVTERQTSGHHRSNATAWKRHENMQASAEMVDLEFG